MSGHDRFALYSSIVTGAVLLGLVGAQVYLEAIGHQADDQISLITKAILAVYIGGRGVAHGIYLTGGDKWQSEARPESSTSQGSESSAKSRQSSS